VIHGTDRSAVPDRFQAVLKYRAGRVEEALLDIEEAVWLDTRPCGFKGQRLQFICPGCGRRVAELYPDWVHFRCRKCCGLGYRSQRKGREARGLEKAARIKQQLGGSGDYADPDPERPKGMYRRTYERLCNEVEKAELPYQDRLMKGLQRLLERSAAPANRIRTPRRGTGREGSAAGPGGAGAPQASETCPRARKDQEGSVTGAASPEGREVTSLTACSSATRISSSFRCWPSRTAVARLSR
jgi:hypothetical protein